MAITDSYPIRRMNECISSLGIAGVRSIHNAISGFWHVEAEDRDKHRTTLWPTTDCDDISEPPFGLMNARETFFGVVDVILELIKWQRAAVHLNDVIVSSTDAEQHMNQVDCVRSRMSQTGM